MKILHVSSWFQPQLGYSEFHLPTALQRLGHSVAVLTSDRYFPFPDYAATVQPLLGGRIVGSGKQVEYGLLAYRRPIAFEYRHHMWLRGFESAVRDFRPDIVHVYQAFTLPTLQSALAKLKYDYGLVVSSSMEKEVFYPQAIERRAYYRLYSIMAGPILRDRVDAFTAVGVGARDIVAQVLGIRGEKVAIFPLGADSERFRFDPVARGEIRRELGIADGVVLVVYAGKLIPRKDVHVLMEALRHIDSHTALAVLLLGNGTPDYKARLDDIAGAARSSVFFRPAVPNSELPRYMSAADIGVWPSESSNAAIEAALVGLPLVVSASEATQHYIAGENGLAFTRGDASALAGNLERLAISPELRRQMGARGRDHMTRLMSWHSAALRAAALYQDVISSRGCGAAIPAQASTRPIR